MEFELKKMNLCLCFLVVGISLILVVNADNINATCTIASLAQTNKTVNGTITITQPVGGGNTTFVGNLMGFTWGGNHGFHVHQYGSLSNNCSGAGAHYNPLNNTHGAPTDVNRHVGDLGNIWADNVTLNSSFTITDNIIQLQGIYSVLGLAIVVHAGEDDLGRGNQSDSNTTGHAGDRIGCCIIMQYPGTSTTTTTTTTVKPAGAGVSIQPLATVFAFCLIAVQLVQKMMDGRLIG